jgi:nucleoid-associated protein EbfC
MMNSLVQSLLFALLLFKSGCAFQQKSLFVQKSSIAIASKNNNALFLFARWGSGSSPEQQHRDSPDSLSGVDQVMQSMQSFKTNQKLGSLTSGVLQELSAARVEGRSEDGKIRVVMNGQQYPMAVQVGDDIDLTTINTALTQAMQDAHSKSVSLMESKLKSFYDELGLPASALKK